MLIPKMTLRGVTAQIPFRRQYKVLHKLKAIQGLSELGCVCVYIYIYEL